MTGPIVQSKPPDFLVATLPHRRRPIDFRLLKERIPISEVLRLLHWEPRSVHGYQLRGSCPLHGGTGKRSRSFSVNTERNIFQCFSCGEKGKQLALWMKASKLPPYEAALDLAVRLGIEVPYLDRWSS